MLEISTLRRIDPKEFGELMIRLGRMKEVTAAETVIVKPNLSSGSSVEAADAETHIVTDLRLMRDVVVSVLEMNPHAMVYIAESDSIWNHFAYLKFARLGLPDCLLLDEEQAKRVAMLDLSRDRLLRVEDERFRYFSTKDKQLWLSETLVTADFVISLSNCKTHQATRFTGACKNLFGCLPTSDKSRYHPKIHEVIHDLTIAISPHVSVVDAFHAMEGNGPIFGCAIDCGYRVFSDDATEADLCACQCAGFTPAQIKYLRYLVRTAKGSEHSHDYPTIISLTEPPLFARTMYAIGVSIQSAGSGLQSYGQRVGGSTNVRQAIRHALRPISNAAKRTLLRVFGEKARRNVKRLLATWLRPQ